MVATAKVLRQDQAAALYLLNQNESIDQQQQQQQSVKLNTENEQLATSISNAHLIIDENRKRDLYQMPLPSYPRPIEFS